MTVWRAGWVLPVAGPPLRDGAVAIRDGVIADVGPAAEVRARTPDPEVRDLGDDAILLPGFVDAHCHLEWSAFDRVVGPRPFHEWMAAFLPVRAVMDEGDHATAARYGAARALAAGTTTLADSGPTGAGVAALAAFGLRGTVHLEAFGTTDDAGEADARAADLAARVADLDGLAAAGDGRVAVGVSPHAPYSTGPALWAALDRRRDLADRGWATHIAESPAEDDAILRRTGPLIDLFAAAGFAVGRWDGDGGGVARRMDAAGALRRDLVAAHCVRVGARDLAVLRDRGVAVAHCPRSNAYLRCGTMPLAALRAAGVPVGLGTDSPASGGDFDLRAEARACREVHGADSPSDAELVHLFTAGAAEALGIADRAGALAPGRPADLVALRRPPAADGADPHTAALDRATTVELVVVGGRVLREAGTTLDPTARSAETAGRALTERLREAAGSTAVPDMP